MTDIKREDDKQLITKRVFILHGYESSPNCNWFTWLKETIEIESTAAVTIIPFPDSNHPVLANWLQTLENQLQYIDEQTIFVAHSLGCITLLHYLNQQAILPRFKALFLVSGFDQPIPNLPQLNPFVVDSLTIDYTKIIATTPVRTVITAKDDGIVPTQLSVDLASHLKASLYKRHSGGHFMQEEGFKTFPLLYYLISQQLF